MTAPYGYKEFRIGDWFDSENGNVDILKNDLSNNGVPVITSGLENNGIIGCTDKSAKVFNKNSITIDMFGNAFYRDFDYKMVTHARVFGIFPLFKMNREVGLYTTSLFSFLPKMFSYNNMCSWIKIKNLNISFPITPNGAPDFDYMTKYIAELETKYIAELETKYIAELETYLKVTGLDNYTLTDRDKDVLSRMADGRVPMGEFRVGDLFEKLPFKNKLNFNKQDDISVIRTKEFNLPLINAKHGENGIMYYGRDSDYESESMTIGIVNDGAISTGDVYPHPEKTGVLYNAYLIKPLFKTVSSEMLMYFACSLEKAIKLRFAYDKKATWDRVSDVYIALPVTIDGTPDYAFMEQYIRAVEKQTIAKLYNSHAMEIQTAKKIINSDI